MNLKSTSRFCFKTQKSITLPSKRKGHASKIPIRRAPSGVSVVHKISPFQRSGLRLIVLYKKRKAPSRGAEAMPHTQTSFIPADAAPAYGARPAALPGRTPKARLFGGCGRFPAQTKSSFFGNRGPHSANANGVLKGDVFLSAVCTLPRAPSARKPSPGKACSFSAQRMMPPPSTSSPR